MELSSFELEALNKIIPLLPTKKHFIIEKILNTTHPYNDYEWVRVNAQKLPELHTKLTEFLLDEAFADDMSNPFIYQYVEGQKSNQFSLRLTADGIRLKESKTFSNYLDLLEKEKKEADVKRLKDKILFISAIIAAIFGIISGLPILIGWLKNAHWL